MKRRFVVYSPRYMRDGYSAAGDGHRCLWIAWLHAAAVPGSYVQEEMVTPRRRWPTVKKLREE